MKLHHRLLVAAVLAGVPIRTAAQPSQDTTLTSVLQAADAKNWYLRVSTPAASFEGRVVELTADSLRLVGSRIALMNINLVERSSKQAGGALIGAAVGGIALGAFGYGLSGLCEGRCPGGGRRGFAAGFMLGAAVGGFGGLLIAPGRETWHALWSR